MIDAVAREKISEIAPHDHALQDRDLASVIAGRVAVVAVDRVLKVPGAMIAADLLIAAMTGVMIVRIAVNRFPFLRLMC
jgi:hypothetical protein